MTLVARRRLYMGFLCAAVGLLSLLPLSFSAVRTFDHDEFEHIHSAWYVQNHLLPYRDFYQVHHPLLWYSVVPFLLVFGNSAETVVAIGVAMYVLTLGIAFSTYAIATRVTGSREVGLLSLVLLLSMVLFVITSIEIRPDVPQVLLGLISIYFFVDFLQTGRTRSMILCGLSASTSFLFLQKSLVLLVAYAAILVHRLLTRRTSMRPVYWFIISVSLPILVFVGHLVISGSLQDYLLTNWVIHTRQLTTYSPLNTLRASLTTENALFWLLLPVSVSFTLLCREAKHELKVITCIGLALPTWVLLKGRPHPQDFLFAIPILCIAVAFFSKAAYDRLNLAAIPRMILLILAVIQPLPSLLAETMPKGHRRRQLAKIDFVIDTSEDSDLVYDGDARFNLYRLDLHYFWFSVAEGKGLDTYNAATNDRYGAYDICELVHSKQPRFISDFEIDIAECGLRHLYEQTPFQGLWFRREPIDGMQQRLWRNLGDLIACLGYSIEPRTVQPGQTIRATVWWEALAETETDYTVFVHVLSPDGALVGQQDLLLQDSSRQSSRWNVGESVRQEHQVQLPTLAPTGEYSIVAGVYYWETGERLAVWDEQGHRVADDTITLGTITVSE